MKASYEDFARLVASGATATAAYLEVFGECKGAAQSASRLLRVAEISARVSELRTARAESPLTLATSPQQRLAIESAISSESNVSAKKGLSIELWDVDRPKDYPLNARKWSKHAIEKVAASIRTYGFRQPVVVDADDTIVIGHLRRAAAKFAGIREIPVHVALDLSPDQVRGLRLADNRTADESDWDQELLAREFAELQELDFDLALTGFGAREIEGILPKRGGLTDPDAVPDGLAQPVTRPGDVWVLGQHRLICGDCTDRAIVARLLQNDHPILMVTDPPYGIQLDSEWRDRAGLNGCGPAESSYMKKRTEGHRETTISGDTRADWSQAFELVPSLQVAYVWHASTFTREVLEGLTRIGFLYPQQIIWDKGRVVLTRTHYWYQHEPCWYVRKKNAPWFGRRGGANSTVWKMPDLESADSVSVDQLRYENLSIWSAPSPKMIMGGSHEQKYDHPTQKPVMLMQKSIANHTNAGEFVFEPFSGSGTTLMAAEMLNRRCLAIELDPKYVDVDVMRWQQYTGQQAVLLDGERAGISFDELKAQASAPAEVVG